MDIQKNRTNSTDRKENKNILNQMKPKRKLMKSIRTRHCNIIMETILEGKVGGKKNKRTTMIQMD